MWLTHVLLLSLPLFFSGLPRAALLGVREDFFDSVESVTGSHYPSFVQHTASLDTGPASIWQGKFARAQLLKATSATVSR